LSLDGQREPVAPAGHGGDGLAPHQAAQTGHLNLQVVVLDDTAWPHMGEGFILAHHIARPGGQQAQQGESTPTDVHGDAGLRQALLMRAPFEICEAQHGIEGVHRARALRPGRCKG
jgi:hypothetical protein